MMQQGIKKRCHCEEVLRADVAISSETEVKWIEYAK